VAVFNHIGAAYVFVRTGTTWAQQRKLLASDGAGGDNFAHAVSVSGDTAAVGAYSENQVGAGAGSAYVFMRTGTTWTEQQKLVASTPRPGAAFGRAMAVSGYTLVVGMPNDGVAGEASQGSAFLFAPADPIFGDGFDPDGSTAVPEAPSEARLEEGDPDRIAADGRLDARRPHVVVHEGLGVTVVDETAEDEDTYRARLEIDLRGLDAAEARVRLLVPVFLLLDRDPSRTLIELAVRREGDVYHLSGQARIDDRTKVHMGTVPLGGRPHRVDLEWRRSSGPRSLDGSFQVWLDGAPVDSHAGP
jgi:hypothetical protein